MKVSRKEAKAAVAEYGKTPLKQKQLIMEKRAVKSIKRGNMYKAGNQVAKAAYYDYKNRDK